MKRRTVLIGLAALVLAAPTGVALASPPTFTVACAQGEITSAVALQRGGPPYGPPRIHTRFQGSIGPCPGASLPSGYRWLSYYSSGTILYLSAYQPFTSTTQPTAFTVDVSVPEGPGLNADPLVAVCAMYDVLRMVSCVAPTGSSANGLPVFATVPTSVVYQHPTWPPRLSTQLPGPDPTCGTCV